MVPSVEAIQVGRRAAAGALAEAEASVARQREALEALLARVARRHRPSAEEQLRALGAAVGEADGAAARIAQDTGPRADRGAGPGARGRQPGRRAGPRGDRRGHPGQRRRARPRRAARRVGEAVSEHGRAADGRDRRSVAQRAIAAARAGVASGSPARCWRSARPPRRSRTGSTRTAREREEKESENFSRRVAAAHRIAQLDRDRRHQDPVERSHRQRLGRLSQGRPRRLHPPRGAAARHQRGARDRPPLRGRARVPRAGEPLHPRFRGDAPPRSSPTATARRSASPSSLSDMGKLYVALAQAIERLRTLDPPQRLGGAVTRGPVEHRRSSTQPKT